MANFYASGHGPVGQYAALFSRSQPGAPAYVSAAIAWQGEWPAGGVVDPRGVWRIDHVAEDAYELGFGPSATGPWTMQPSHGSVTLFVAY